MKKPFKKLFGYRVYLLAPEIGSSKVVLSGEAKKEVVKAKMKDFMRLKVYAVGSLVDSVKEGDEVLIGDRALSNSPIIDLTDDLSVILIDVHEIIHIW